jgi:hypothetical protein
MKRRRQGRKRKVTRKERTVFMWVAVVDNYPQITPLRHMKHLFLEHPIKELPKKNVELALKSTFF